MKKRRSRSVAKFQMWHDRSVTKSEEWRICSGISDMAKSVCSEMSEVAKMVLKPIFSFKEWGFRSILLQIVFHCYNQLYLFHSFSVTTSATGFSWKNFLIRGVSFWSRIPICSEKHFVTDFLLNLFSHHVWASEFLVHFGYVFSLK